MTKTDNWSKHKKISSITKPLYYFLISDCSTSKNFSFLWLKKQRIKKKNPSIFFFNVYVAVVLRVHCSKIVHQWKGTRKRENERENERTEKKKGAYKCRMIYILFLLLFSSSTYTGLLEKNLVHAHVYICNQF